MTDNDKMMMAGMIAGRVKSHNKKRLEAARRLMVRDDFVEHVLSEEMAKRGKAES